MQRWFLVAGSHTKWPGDGGGMQMTSGGWGGALRDRIFLSRSLWALSARPSAEL